MRLLQRPLSHLSPSDHYRQRLARAAGLGFVSSFLSIRGRSPRWRIIKGMLDRGFRRPKFTITQGGVVLIRAYYGDHLITPIFSFNADGSLPDQTILAALYKTADRMDARRPGGLKKKRRRQTPPAELGHPLYVFHGNEQPKLDELVSALPPAGGMRAYLEQMSANEGPAEGIKDAA